MTDRSSEDTHPGVRMLVLGRQGAGKGTQAARVSTRCGVPHISTGDMLRSAVREGTELGLKAKAIMDAGELVSDDVMIGIVNERLRADDAENGWILDGFPRTVGQAEALANITVDAPLQVVVDLEVDNAHVIERISARRVCDGCGTNYRDGDAAIVTGTCPKCAGTPRQRDDDKPDAIAHRLALYERETAPLVDYYRGMGLLEIVDGLGFEDEVFDRIMTVIDARVSNASRG